MNNKLKIYSGLLALTLIGCATKSDIIIEDFKVKDGYVEVPQKPGLGIEVDESIFK